MVARPPMWAYVCGASAEYDGGAEKAEEGTACGGLHCCGPPAINCLLGWCLLLTDSLETEIMSAFEGPFQP